MRRIATLVLLPMQVPCSVQKSVVRETSEGGPVVQEVLHGGVVGSQLLLVLHFFASGKRFVAQIGGTPLAPEPPT